MLFYWGNLLHSIRLCLFGGKTKYCAIGHAQLHWLCCVFQSHMLNVYHSPAKVFPSVHLSLLAQYQLQRLSLLQQTGPPVIFLFLMWLSVPMLSPSLGLLFWWFWVLISWCGTWSCSRCKVHITLQELQAVALILCKMVLSLSGNLVVLHLNNSSAEAYL